MEQADLPQYRARELLTKQLTLLRELAGKDYRVAKQEEDQWQLLTARIIVRSFGSNSAYVLQFERARKAGVYRRIAFHGRIDHQRNQRNYQARINACEAVLKTCLADLELDLPQTQKKE